MPEVLATLGLQIPSENISENEATSTTADGTDRSTDSRNNREAVTGKKIVAKHQGKNKVRKSCGRRSQKKSQLRPLTSEKNLKPKSNIPRALVLTPSSSNASITTNNSLPSPVIHVVKTLTEEKRLENKDSNRSCIIRQKSAVILAFRQRKSYSQMEFNNSRHQINFNSPSKYYYENSQPLQNTTVAHPKNSFVPKMYNQDYCFAMPPPDPQMAGMRIFATIMLNAWRKRRDEVRRLIDEVADLKRTAIKTKNQLHVFNSLFRVEQKRNDDLHFQLKKQLENVNFTKTSCESLTTSLISLKADKSLLEQQLQSKEYEFETINTLLSETKSDLFKSMTLQRELQAVLSTEQRKVQTLEHQKNELINEICDLNNEALQNEDDLRKKIQDKCNEIVYLNEKYDAVDEELGAFKRATEQLLSENKGREDRMRREIEVLESELKIREELLENTVGNRLKILWNNAVTYQKITFQILHWIAYCALPATPPPKIKSLPFGLSLDKALGIVKR